MEDDSKKWLIAGLAGALLTLVLMVTVVILIFRQVPVIFELGEEILTDLDEGDTIDGPEQYAEEVAEYEAEQAELAATIKRLKLDERYETVYLYGDTRHHLYHEKNFPLVEERLTEALAACDTPLAYYRYSQLIDSLGTYYYADGDPAELLAILDTWVQERPESHHALLVRGAFEYRYAWYFRGDGLAYTVSDAGWVGFHQQLNNAKEDLEAALGMNSIDPSPAEKLLGVVTVLGDGRAAEDFFYNEALRRNPHSIPARMTKLNYDQPKWGGSWEEMEAIGAEAAEASKDFPLLGTVQAYSKELMYSRDEHYKQEWDSRNVFREYLAVYEAQLTETPDDLLLQANAAYYGAQAPRVEQATLRFQAMGDTFPAGSKFDDVVEYNEHRAYVYAMYARKRSMRGTPEAAALLAEAYALNPEHEYVNYANGEYYLEQEDYAKAREHLEKADQEYDNVWLALARLNFHEGNLEASREYAERFIEQSTWDEGLASARELLAILDGE